MEQKISKETHKHILDYFKVKKIPIYGGLDELDFLERLYDLEKMESCDSRYDNARQDIEQHTFFNDWDDGWVFKDSRFELKDDDKFLLFLCETIHPAVRSDEGKVREIVDFLNNILQKHGYRIFQELKNELAIYNWSKIDSCTLKLYSTESNCMINPLLHDTIFTRYGLACERIGNSDYEGAITTARSLIETVLLSSLDEEGKKYKGNLDLIYKAFKKRFKNFDPSCEHFEDTLKQILTGLNSIVLGIASMRNKTGDGHGENIKSHKNYKPSKHHAELVLNASLTFSQFIASSLEHQKIKIDNFEGSNLQEFVKSPK